MRQKAFLASSKYSVAIKRPFILSLSRIAKLWCKNGKMIYWERKRSTPCIFNQKILQYSYVTRTSLLAIRTSLLAIRTSLLAIRTLLLVESTSLLVKSTSLLVTRGLHINPNTLLWRTYCATNATLRGLAGRTAVRLLFLHFTLLEVGLLDLLTEVIPIIKSRNLLK